MTPKNTPEPEGDDSLSVLDDTASSDTTGIGLGGGTAQVNVSLPIDEDDELDDDAVVDDEIISDLVIDTSALADDEMVARITQDTPDIVIELPPEQLPASPATDAEEEPAADAEPDPQPQPQPQLEEIIVEAEPAPDTAAPASDAQTAREAGLPETADAVEPDAVGPDADRVEEPEAETAEADPSVAGIESAVAAAKAQLREAMSSTPPKNPKAPNPPAEAAEQRNDAAGTKPAAASASAASPAAPASAPAPATRAHAAEVTLTAKRLDDLGEAERESADLLTTDRLLDPHRVTRPEPEGTWSHLLYSLSGGRLNIGDSPKARARKELTARIAAPLTGTARFVPVLSRKGGVGKTTVTVLLGMALADARDDRVIAVDANPDRGTLAERAVGAHTKSVRDLVRAQHDIRGYHDVSALVARDETRLDVLASDSDPRVSEAFGDADYRNVATVAAQYYSLVLTDSGTGIVHSVMSATLELADQVVIVSGLSVDEARLASETLTWLETNGHAERARNAIVVLNQSTPGAPLVRLNELEAHFSTRARAVLRIPYDAQIAGGGPIHFASLAPETRRAARELAAMLVEGLRVVNA